MPHDKATVIYREYSEHAALTACYQGHCLNIKLFNVDMEPPSSHSRTWRLSKYLSHLDKNVAFWSWLLVYFIDSIERVVSTQFEAIDCIVYILSSGS